MNYSFGIITFVAVGQHPAITTLHRVVARQLRSAMDRIGFARNYENTMERVSQAVESKRRQAIGGASVDLRVFTMLEYSSMMDSGVSTTLRSRTMEGLKRTKNRGSFDADLPAMWGHRSGSSTWH